MTHPHRTGTYISSLRKVKDWTQLELAEKLHVTHQAVSQWEKGASFPDVSLLPQLARLFGISVDDLLNGEPVSQTASVSAGAIVEELAHANQSDVGRLVRRDPEGNDMMIDAVQIASPSQSDKVVSNMGGFTFTLPQVVNLAPFVSQALLQSILDSATFEQIEASMVVELAPFLGQETLESFFQRITEGTLNLDQLMELAPFLRPTTLKAQVFRLLEADQPLQSKHLGMMAPFLDKEILQQLIQNIPEGPLPIELVAELAPFMSQASLDRLISRLEDPAALGDHLAELTPFLNKSTLKRVMAQFNGRLSTETLLEIAPYLGKESLEEILRNGAGAIRD